MHRSARYRGFTTIELVAVLAVTLLIASLGISAYDTYRVRAEIAAGLALTGLAQARVAAAFRDWGVPPEDRARADIPADMLRAFEGTAVESLDVVNGRIDLHFGAAAPAAIAGKTLSLTPFETASQEIVWICGNKIPNVGLNPLGFAGGAVQATQVLTTIEARYLPPLCR